MSYTRLRASTGRRPWRSSFDHAAADPQRFGHRHDQSTVAAFNLFDEAWVLTARASIRGRILIEIYMLETFQNLHFSYGMALSSGGASCRWLVSLLYVMRLRDTRFE